MSTTIKRILTTLEERRALAFTIAGVVFAADLAILLFNLSAGTENQFMDLGQAFIGTAWTAGFLGLLGFYPSLSDRSRWLTRIGAFFSVLGFVAMVVMAVVSFSVFGGLLGGSLEPYVPLFLPGVFLGIVFGFGLFGVAALRSGTYTAPWAGSCCCSSAPSCSISERVSWRCSPTSRRSSVSSRSLS
ncbi:hypothetical protein [Haloglomus litoreum]|uniref:hypothetical protein n=1 Tax=Haloglomus litoreum TaxID=3034026 RepID=UPI0023E759EE|nr:hypothetical protein [Haloglomus sp. DT116]